MHIIHKSHDMSALRNIDKLEHFCQDFTPLTPNDPEKNFRPITSVESIELIHMHESHDHVMLSVGGVGICENYLFNPCKPLCDL